MDGASKGGDLGSLGSSRGLRRSLLESLGVLVPLLLVLSLPLDKDVFFLGIWVWRG